MLISRRILSALILLGLFSASALPSRACADGPGFFARIEKQAPSLTPTGPNIDSGDSGTPKRYQSAGFIINIGIDWYLITANHAISDVDRHLDRVDLTLSAPIAKSYGKLAEFVDTSHGIIHDAEADLAVYPLKADVSKALAPYLGTASFITPPKGGDIDQPIVMVYGNPDLAGSLYAESPFERALFVTAGERYVRGLRPNAGSGMKWLEGQADLVRPGYSGGPLLAIHSASIGNKAVYQLQGMLVLASRKEKSSSTTIKTRFAVSWPVIASAIAALRTEPQFAQSTVVDGAIPSFVAYFGDSQRLAKGDALNLAFRSVCFDCGTVPADTKLIVGPRNWLSESAMPRTVTKWVLSSDNQGVASIGEAVKKSVENTMRRKISLRDVQSMEREVGSLRGSVFQLMEFGGMEDAPLTINSWDLRGASFVNCRFANVRLHGCVLDFVSFVGCEFGEKVEFVPLSMRQARFFDCEGLDLVSRWTTKPTPVKDSLNPFQDVLRGTVELASGDEDYEGVLPGEEAARQSVTISGVRREELISFLGQVDQAGATLISAARSKPSNALRNPGLSSPYAEIISALEGADRLIKRSDNRLTGILRAYEIDDPLLAYSLAVRSAERSVDAAPFGEAISEDQLAGLRCAAYGLRRAQRFAGLTERDRFEVVAVLRDLDLRSSRLLARIEIAEQTHSNPGFGPRRGNDGVIIGEPACPVYFPPSGFGRTKLCAPILRRR
jgi:S1-C subfamily serine protease